MRIDLYLNDTEETAITTMYDVVSNPFKVGDIINLSVEEVSPLKLTKISSRMANTLLDDNRNKSNLFHMKKVEIIKENKYLELENNTLIVEYFCKLVWS